MTGFRRRRGVCLAALFGALVCLSLCGAGCTVFQSYPERIGYAQGAFLDGDYGEAAHALEIQNPPDRDKLVFLMELGTYLHTKGDYEASNEKFLEAVGIMRAYDDRARIAVRDGASFAGAVIVNDAMRPYRGSDYERVLLHTYLAMNYLLMKKLDDARVEVLQAYAKQKEAREEHERAIRETKKEVSEKQLDGDKITKLVRNAYKEERRILKKAGNLYQNLFTYYLSSLVYELGGEYDDAYIDAHTVYSLNPAFPPARKDLLRLAWKSGRRRDFDRWRRRFGEVKGWRVPPGHGEIVLFYECGEAPVMDQVKLAIPAPTRDKKGQQVWTSVTVAIPKFHRRPNPVREAWLYVDGKQAGRSYALMDVEATAIRNLWDKAPAIAMRQVIRAAGRYAADRYARTQGGNLLGTLVALLGFAMEQADRRSWVSLPQSFQVARVTVPAGSHTVGLRLAGLRASGRVTLKDVKVRDGGITIVDLRSTGVRGTARYVTF